MKLIFLSNFFNYHQAALCDALWELTGGEFRFVETEDMPAQRKELGFRCLQRPYLLRLEEHGEVIFQALKDADAVLAGEAPEHLIRRRIRTGKLLLRYSERPLRNGAEPLKYLPRWIRWHWRNPKGLPIYQLCASAYTAGDYARFGLFQGRCFRWGYFPETRESTPEGLFREKDPAHILWCGRFLGWKHPHAALAAAGRLRQEGFRFTLDLIGGGAEEAALRQQIRQLGLQECVRLLGTMDQKQVRQHMERAGIYLFTSDRREGWGVVLNEAMNSGCAVIASHAIGSVPYLIRPGENGLVYPSGNQERLYECLKYLLLHPREQQRLGERAYETIHCCWNAEEAARRLLVLTECLLRGEDGRGLYAEGPCSLSEQRREDWFR